MILYDHIWLAVDGQVEDIGASIMNPARPAHLTRIDVGVKEGFSLVEGPGDALAIWESVSTASQLWTADLLLIAHL